MKNNIKLIIISIVAIFIVGCSSKHELTNKNVKVTVTTSFLSDMVKEVTAGEIKPELIIPAGEDPHLYLAKPNDIKKIKEADIVFFHGLHFEGKMIDVLEKKGVAVSKNFPKDKIGEMDEDGNTVVDPHFWFDIGLYKEAVKVVNEELGKLLPEKKEIFNKNTEAYLVKLDELNENNKKLLEEIPEQSRKLITPHDAFNYFSRAYNIEVKAPQGVSTDSEVSTNDINSTVDFIIKNKVKAIFVESTTDPTRMKKLQEAVRQKGFDVKIVSGEGKELFSDSLAEEGKDGDTYISMYKHNIKLIVDNLK